ncbi:hypothetical protein C5167_042651, partial [Papaver somniferum]
REPGFSGLALEEREPVAEVFLSFRLTSIGRNAVREEAAVILHIIEEPKDTVVKRECNITQNKVKGSGHRERQMENDREKLKNKFMATSRPTSSSSDFARETYQRTDKGFLVSENNTCHVDVSTTYITVDGMLMVADSCGSLAVKPNADKGEPYPRTDMDSESSTSRYDGLATEEEAISLCNNILARAVIPMSGKGEPDSHGSQAVILKELIPKDCKGGPYPRSHMGLLYFESLDDGPTTKESISLCNDLSVSPTVIPMSGKGSVVVLSSPCE